MEEKPIVGVIMGSDSDLPVMQEAVKIVESFGVACKPRILSAHRTSDAVRSYAKSASKQGIWIIIAAAGGAAHLAGMAASWTHLPVIGVPIESKFLKGMDSLFSTVQMPLGVPVATVAINGAGNAGLLAIRMLAMSDERLAKKLRKYQRELGESVEKKDAKLVRLGPVAYLDS